MQLSHPSGHGDLLAILNVSPEEGFDALERVELLARSPLGGRQSGLRLIFRVNLFHTTTGAGHWEVEQEVVISMNSAIFPARGRPRGKNCSPIAFDHCFSLGGIHIIPA